MKDANVPLHVNEVIDWANSFSIKTDLKTLTLKDTCENTLCQPALVALAKKHMNLAITWQHNLII